MSSGGPKVLYLRCHGASKLRSCFGPLTLTYTLSPQPISPPHSKGPQMAVARENSRRSSLPRVGEKLGSYCHPVGVKP